MISNKTKAKLMEVINDNILHINNGFTLYFVIKFIPINSVSEFTQTTIPDCLQYTIESQSIVFHLQVNKSLYTMEIKKNSDRAFLSGVIKTGSKKKALPDLCNSIIENIESRQQVLYEGQEFYAINFEWLDEDTNKIKRVKANTNAKYKV
jgi:hypothetical protein